MAANPNDQIPMTKDQLKPNDPNDLIDVDERRLMAALSYVGVLVFIPLLTAKNDPFILLHAKQGLVLVIGYVVAILAVNWIETAGSILFLVLLLVNVIALVQALLGKRWRIPGIYQIANSFKI